MAQEKIDWAILRGAIGVFSICLLVGSILLGATKYFRDEMETEFRNHQTKFRDVSRKYLAVDDEERIIENIYPEFVRLYQSGILGQEHRLSWIESLREAGNRIKLPEISYQVSSQSTYVPDFPIDLGAFDIHVSKMHLTLGLLHEGDLLGLFNALDREANGLYSISRCKATRLDKETEISPNRPTISAACSLDWFTVDLKGERALSL